MSQLIFNITKSNQQIDSVVILGREIWTEHYAPIIGMDQVNYMLDKFQSAKAIKNQLNEGYIYYIINNGKKDIGYLSVQPRNNKLFLSKIYIHKTQRGNNYFSIALNYIENLARKANLKIIELTVNKYNKHSISIYQAKGFKVISSEVFDIGNGYVMDDYVMSKPI